MAGVIKMSNDLINHLNLKNCVQKKCDFLLLNYEFVPINY